MVRMEKKNVFCSPQYDNILSRYTIYNIFLSSVVFFYINFFLRTLYSMASPRDDINNVLVRCGSKIDEDWQVYVLVLFCTLYYVLKGDYCREI